MSEIKFIGAGVCLIGVLISTQASEISEANSDSLNRLNRFTIANQLSDEYNYDTRGNLLKVVRRKQGVCSGGNPLWQEDFEGSALNPSKWTVINEGSGSIVVKDGAVSVTAFESLRFPTLVSEAPDLSNTSNWSFSCGFAYSGLNGHGMSACGLAETVFENEGYTFQSGNRINVWGDSSGLIWSIYDAATNQQHSVLENDWTSEKQVTWCINDNRVAVYVNGAKRADFSFSPGWSKPQKVFIGNPVLTGGYFPWSSTSTTSISIRHN